MKDVKAFEDAVASARVHLTNCGPVGDNEEDCFTCRSARALVEAHVDLERYKINGHLLTRCDLRHVYVNKYRVDGGCPYCHQLMNREAYIQRLRQEIGDIIPYLPKVYGALCTNLLNEPPPDAPIAKKLLAVTRHLAELHDRISDPALKRHIYDDIIEPLRNAFSGVQP